MRSLILVFFLLQACSTTQVAQSPLIPYHPEERILPPDPKDEPLPPIKDTKIWTKPMADGILYSEAKAFQAVKYEVRYKQLRDDYIQDRRIWVEQRALYESLRPQPPTLWDEYKPYIALGIGVLLGGATAGFAVWAASH